MEDTFDRFCRQNKTRISREGAADQELLDLIFEWAEGQTTFDTAYVERLQEFLSARGELTPNQREAVERIIDKWGIA